MKKTLYSEIINYLRRQIDDGNFSYDEPIATEKTLSQQFGVSIITVRRALDELTREGLLWKKRGCGCFVRKDREKFFSIKAPHTERTKKLISIIVCLTDKHNGVLDIIKGCTEKLTELNYISGIVDSSNFKHDRTYFDQLSIKDNLSGAIHILIDESFSDSNIIDMYNSGIPSVTTDKHVSINIPSVLSDNLDGGLMAAKHLFELGHKSIAFFSDSPFDSSETVRDRYMGYCNAHIEAGIKPNKDFCMFSGQDIYGNIFFSKNINEKDGDELAHELDFYGRQINYLVSNGVTAIQVSNDHVAIRVIKAAIKNGINVPKDLSVIGFDDSSVGHCSEVPLTTIKQDFYSMGYRAAEVLYKAIIGKKLKIAEFIPVELIKRESTDFVDILQSTNF